MPGEQSADGTFSKRFGRVLLMMLFIAIVFTAGLIAVQEFDLSPGAAYTAGVVVAAVIVEPVASRLRTWERWPP